MIIDANILLYAVDQTSPHHEASATWLIDTLNSGVRVGLPWQTIGAFLRISTHPRVYARPLAATDAQDIVDHWLALGSVWVPAATERTARLYGDLARRYRVTGNLVPDAQLAALALEHGLAVASADTDFARFREVRWVNPVAT